MRRTIAGFVLLLVLGTAPEARPDVNVRCGVTSAPPQPGYYSLATNNPGNIQTLSQTFNAVDASVCPGGTMTVALSGGTTAGTTTVSPFYRDRGTPANSGAFTDGPLYETFAGYSLTAGNYLWITASGLKPGASYMMTLYACDNVYSGTMSYTDYGSGSAGASGTIAYTAGTNFGSLGAAANAHFSTTLLVTANAGGAVVIRGTGTGFQGSLNGIVNGFDLTPLISVAPQGAAYGDCNLYNDTTLGTPAGTILNCGESGVDNNNCHVYIPFSVSGTTVTSVQAAAAVNLLFNLRGNTAATYTVDLYGYPNRGAATNAANGDYSGGTLLQTGVMTGQSALGWQAVDVTQWVQQQVDAGNTAICFKLQIHEAGLPNGDGHQTNYALNPADGGVLTAPYLEVTIHHADATSVDDKMIVSYTGWFHCPGDTTGNTIFGHWTTNSSATVTAGGSRNYGPEFWPDMSLCSASEQYPTAGLIYPGGATAALFSSFNPRTVLRHFAWMGRYNMDSAIYSEFQSHLPGGTNYSANDYAAMRLLQADIEQDAALTGRSWLKGYDTSGGQANIATVVENDWSALVASGATAKAGYMHHGGKPVVFLYGFFANDTNHPLGNPTIGQPVIDWFHQQGCYVIGCGNWNLTGDMANSAAYAAMIQTLESYVPWNIGHVHTETVNGQTIGACTDSFWADGLNSFNGKYMPAVMPGCSNLSARRRGGFLWEQFEYIATLLKSGANTKINTVYLTQLEDFSEGAQIVPVTDNGPTQFSPLLPGYSEGGTPLPTTCYMQWTGLGGYYLKTGQTPPAAVPATVPY